MEPLRIPHTDLNDLKNSLELYSKILSWIFIDDIYNSNPSSQG
jgi:hypothetical protein